MSRRGYDEDVILQLRQTFYPRHDPPASFDKPMNGTKKQKREWEIAMIAWTLDWLDAVFEAPFRPVEGRMRYTPDGDIIVRVSTELAQEVKEREARQRRLAAVLAEFPDDLQRKPPPPAPPPTNKPRTQEKERDLAGWALRTVRMIWDMQYGRKNMPTDSDLAKEIVAYWMEWLPAAQNKQKEKGVQLVEQATKEGIERLLHKSGKSGPKKRRR